MTTTIVFTTVYGVELHSLPHVYIFISQSQFIGSRTDFVAPFNVIIEFGLTEVAPAQNNCKSDLFRICQFGKILGSVFRHNFLPVKTVAM